MRVIAGSAKGRKLLSVPGSGTRPITDRVKGALFDILGGDVRGSALLDLFAGTGAVGIEALSRDAERVVFVDRGSKAINTLRKNLEITGFVQRAEVIHADAFRYIKRVDHQMAFDYIYVAPPQYREFWAKALLLLNERPLLAPDGVIIVQIHPKEFRELLTPNLRLTRQRRYGSTQLCFYELSGGQANEE